MCVYKPTRARFMKPRKLIFFTKPFLIKAGFGFAVTIAMIVGAFMSKDGTFFMLGSILVPALTTGAGISTIVTGQQQCDNIIVVGAVDTANPLQGLVVEIGGTAFINILNNAAIVGAFAKWMSGAIDAGASTVVGLALRIATGQIIRNTKLTFVNNGATTPVVYSYSDNDNGSPVNAATNSINPNSFQVYEKFSCLIIATPANVTNFDVLYRCMDPRTGKFTGRYIRTNMTMQEMAADYISYNPNAEASGLVNTCLIIDNRSKRFQSVRINVGATAVVVCTVALPQAAFDALNG